jgi:hypothetical protein
MVEPSTETNARHGWVSRAALAAATLALLLQAGAWLVATPAVGMADRGDYYRVAKPAGIFGSTPRVDENGRPLLQRTYTRGRSRLAKGATSASVVALIAKHGSAFDSSNAFDIRALGVTYVLIASSIVGALLLSGAHAGLCFALTWVLVDPTYLAYCNSLYSEPAALGALFGITLWLSRWGRAGALLPSLATNRMLPQFAALLVLLSFAGFSRAAMALLPCLVVLLLALRWLRTRPAISPFGIVPCALLGAVVLAPALYFSVGPGPRFQRINTFHAVFYGPVALSNDPAGALRSLGLDESAASLARKSYFEANPSPELERDVSHVSFGERVFAYAREPVTALRAAQVLARHLVEGDVSPVYEVPGASRGALAPSFHWVRRTLLGVYPPLVWGALAAMGVFLWLVATRRLRPKIAPDAMALLWTVSVTQPFIAVLGDGLFGLGRHLVVARYAFDSACAILLVEACARVAPLFPRRGARS